jgi:hypothetical protein
MEYIYHCKKNGRDYTVKSESAPQVSNDYAWRRGVREYLDNYHASVTRKGWEGTDEEFTAQIDAHVTEAVARFNAGDIPGERVAADPKLVAMRNATAKLVGTVDPTKLAAVDPAKLAAWLEKQSTQGRAA